MPDGLVFSEFSRLLLHSPLRHGPLTIYITTLRMSFFAVMNYLNFHLFA